MVHSEFSVQLCPKLNNMRSQTSLVSSSQTHLDGLLDAHIADKIIVMLSTHDFVSMNDHSIKNMLSLNHIVRMKY